MKKSVSKWAVVLLLVAITIAVQSNITAAETNNPVTAALGCQLPTVQFEAGIPASWSTTAISAVTFAEMASCTSSLVPTAENWTNGSGDLRCANSDAQANVPFDTRLLSNEFTIPGDATVADLLYKANYQDFSASVGRDLLDLDISTDGGSNWTNLISWNDNYGNQQALPGENVTQSLLAYKGQTVLVRWRYYDLDSNAWDWYAQIDEVSLLCDKGVDFSDSSPTITGAAWHEDPGTRALWLGPLVTNDANDLDGTDAVTNDGVIRESRWVQGGTAVLGITVGGSNGWLAGWIDWDGSGTFENPGERVLDEAVTSGQNTVSFPIPGEYTTGSTVRARFRLYPAEPSTQAVDSAAAPIGGAADGEVEDYTWDFTPSAVSLTAIAAGSPIALRLLAVGSAALLLLLILVVGYRRSRRSRLTS